LAAALARPVLVVLVVLALGFAAALVGSVDPPPKGTLAFETRKLFVQFLLIAAGGALVASLLELFKERRHAQELQSEYRTRAIRTTLDNLDTIYTDVKRERRELRLFPRESVPRHEYEAIVKRLRELQTDAELLKRNVRALAPRLPALGSLDADLDSLDRYLSRLWSEAEATLGSSAPGDDLNLASLPRVLGFVAHRREPEATFEDVAGPYTRVRDRLVELLGDALTEGGTVV
jgi:hypothetical protein